MPSVSQFPPARVFLKTPLSPTSMNKMSVPWRQASMTQTPIPRALTTTSSITSPVQSQIQMQQSNGTKRGSDSRGSVLTA
ncbi:hypothetical protein P154DRAFT_519541 [Amniculicola lignicola CBS 123094]|uniref:Uncharacterized protein n=1 Tax=Amniculicola lignicola CBS 123094 TaxID=1392246 RepID=A0A6A5WW21_9PLEO|nr:hypothetical protein P154DRAFT_519541 [Amniculicola lignicola CBS 123094]